MICKKGLHTYIGKQCKECKKIAVKAWVKANPEKALAKQNKFWKRNPDKNAAKSRAFYKANPEKALAFCAKRRAIKLQRTPAWLTREHYNKITALYKESKRLKNQYGTQYCVDHIIPLSGELVSGLHVPWNLQILTKSQNSSKSNFFDGTYENNGWQNER